MMVIYKMKLPKGFYIADVRYYFIYTSYLSSTYVNGRYKSNENINWFYSDSLYIYFIRISLLFSKLRKQVKFKALFHIAIIFKDLNFKS